MIPRISPGKTWEGFAGALVVSTAVSLVVAHFAGDRLAGLEIIHAVVIGIVLGVGAVMGDLVESLFKREAGVKDSGAYFPGIGGVLDLVDSLLFNSPVMAAYLAWLITR
jgi:phosphatidate cytidylyltransferase